MTTMTSISLSSVGKQLFERQRAQTGRRTVGVVIENRFEIGRERLNAKRIVPLFLRSDDTDETI
jgi:hypothetical protein